MTIRALVALSLAGLGAGGCALSLNQAARPADWNDLSVRQHTVSGFGDWARLRGKEPQIGVFSVAALDQSWWDRAPLRESDTVTLGDASFGQSRTSQDTSYSFELRHAGIAVARIQCRQRVDIRDWQGTLNDGTDSQFQVEGNESYLGTLACGAQAIARDWQPWRLDLRTFPRRPLFGILRVGDASFAVLGSQEAGSGAIPATAGYLIQDTKGTAMLVDRLNAGAVSSRPDLASADSNAMMAAAAALLLASDPVEIYLSDPEP